LIEVVADFCFTLVHDFVSQGKRLGCRIVPKKKFDRV
jgi:hypothetical protein